MELNMKHLKKLIKEYKNLSKMDWAVKEDMADMYKQDAQDFTSVLNMIKDKNYDDFKDNFKDNREYLKNHISNMIDQSNFLIDKMAEFKKGSK